MKIQTPAAIVEKKPGRGVGGFLFRCFAALVFTASTISAFAQLAAPASPDVQENRYLFVVETSHDMLPRALGSLSAVTELLASGMDGQIHQGDTIALWTFDDQLYAGRFPIQHWVADQQGEIMSRILNYLKDQKVGKPSKLDNVLMALGYVIQGSQFVTIVLVTDGEEKIHGTPFDNQINSECARYMKKQRKAKMPFVIILRAVKGNITEYAVATPPNPIRVPPVPPLAPPVQLTKAAAPKLDNLPAGALVFSGAAPNPIVVKNPAQPPAAAPAGVAKVETPIAPAPAPSAPAPVVTPKVDDVPAAALTATIEAPSVSFGSASPSAKVESPQPTASAGQPANTNSTPPVPVVAPASPAVTTSAATPPAPVPAPVVTPAPAPAVTIIPPALPTPAPAPAPAVAATPPTPKPEPVKAPEPKADAPKPVTPMATTIVAPASAPAISNAAPVAPVIAASVSKPTPTAITSNATPAAAVAAAPTPKTSSALETKPAPAPMVAPATANAPEPLAAATTHSPDLHPVKAHAHAHPAAAHPQVAMVTPLQRLTSQWAFWAAAILLIAAAIWSSIVYSRRSHVEPSASLITCSFDRNKKG